MKGNLAIGIIATVLSMDARAQEVAVTAPDASGKPSIGVAESGDRRPISNPQGNPASPVRGIDRAERKIGSAQGDLQSFDGVGNNLTFETMGAIQSPLVRVMPPAYGDGVSSMAGAGRPSARHISNQLHAQGKSRPNTAGFSDFLWQWGQFLDHDIDLTDGAEPEEPAPIAVPAGDEYFDPDASGTAVIDMNRSIYDHDSGTHSANPRQQINEITAWIDASNVYGSDSERAMALRTLDGTGRLKTSRGNLLPFNVNGLPNAGGSGAHLFLAGDVRANEQVGLTAMHTLFVREHNRLANQIARRNPRATGEELYQSARREVIALMQVITFEEFLPALLGPDAIAPYSGYDPGVNAGIRNVFSTAAFRLGHTLLSPTLLRLEANGTESRYGHLSLADAFFQPRRLIKEGGIEPLLRGLASQECQGVDVYVVDEVRNFLFGLPGSGGFDLASLNIQRGRDHGLGSYNDARAAYGLPRITDFAQVSSNPAVVARLRAAYASAEDMDIWSAGLAEDAVGDGLVGELFHTILVDQFTALRDGDRFWYENIYDHAKVRRLENTTLADIIRRNTRIGMEIPDNVFVVQDKPGRGNPRRRVPR